MWEKRARPKALPSFAELVPEGAAAAAAGSDPTLTSLTACKALKGLGDAQKAGGGRGVPIHTTTRKPPSLVRCIAFTTSRSVEKQHVFTLG